MPLRCAWLYTEFFVPGCAACCAGTISALPRLLPRLQISCAQGASLPLTFLRLLGGAAAAGGVAGSGMAANGMVWQVLLFASPSTRNKYGFVLLPRYARMPAWFWNIILPVLTDRRTGTWGCVDI